MDNIYDALKKANRENDTSQFERLPKDEYVRHKKAEKQELYDMANEQCINAVGDGNSYLKFLELLSRHDYTITNTLLVMAQYPEATVLKDNQRWKEDKLYVRKGEKGIRILMPSGEYEKDDGSIGTGYIVKSVFDVEQLSKDVILNEDSYTVKEVLQGILYHSPVNIQLMDNIDNDVMYSPDLKTIFYKNNLSPQQLLYGLIRETCYAEFDNQYRTEGRDSDRFICESAGYMLCRKFGIEAGDVSFADDSKSYFEDMETKDVKEELGNVKSLADDVKERMEKGIYKAQQHKQNERKDVSR